MGVGINSVGVMYTAAALLALSLSPRKKAMEKGGLAQSQSEEGINIVSEE